MAPPIRAASASVPNSQSTTRAHRRRRRDRSSPLVRRNGARRPAPGRAPGELRHNRQQDHQTDAGKTERRDQCERHIKRRIRHDVSDLVQVTAENALLMKLARQHPVDGVERHASEQPHRDQQEHPTRVSTRCRNRAHQDGSERCHNRHHVRRHADPGQRHNQGAKQALKTRLQRVERHPHLVMRESEQTRLRARVPAIIGRKMRYRSRKGERWADHDMSRA